MSSSWANTQLKDKPFAAKVLHFPKWTRAGTQRDLQSWMRCGLSMSTEFASVKRKDKQVQNRQVTTRCVFVM